MITTLQNLFRRRTPELSEAEAVMARAAEMLAAPSATLQLTQQEAHVVVRYMRPIRFSQGVTFIREGDETTTGFLLMVLEGEVVVESIVVSRTAPITVKVLGPGSMHGDIGLIDGLPRSASCTAGTDLLGVVLTREGLNKLLKRHPRVCSKLMMAIAMRIGARLRENTITLKRYVALTRAMQEEIDHLMPH